uniref:Putative methyltransferase n=1 Tax=viral metagenome TaxID=1070528 RepID=A0A6M3L1M3_9ZZZZ
MTVEASRSTSTVLSGSGVKSVEELVQEIDLFLEAITKKAGILTPEGRKLERRYALKLSLYFSKMARNFPYSRLSSFVGQYQVKESRLLESKEKDAQKITSKAAEAQSEELYEILVDNNGTGYALSGAQAVRSVRMKATFEVVDDGAKKWIRKEAAAKVTKINEVTRDRLARVLSEGVDRGQSVAKIAKNIRAEVGDMSRYRSKMIAQTELNNAMSEASLRTYERLGVENKSWSTSGDACEICLGNEAEGIVPIDHVFSSGDERPPSHPNCLCVLSPEKGEKESVEEAMTPADWKAEYKKGIPHWAKDMEPSLFAEEFVKLMKKHKVDSVLEVGCGNGRDSILFAKSGFKATSIDVVPKAVELAKTNILKAKVDVTVKVATVEDLPFDDAEFGAVFTLSVLHSTNLKKSLPEVARVLQPNGIAFIYIYGDTQFKNGKKTEDTITWSDYLSTLKKLGFKVLESYTDNEKEYDEFGEKHKIFVVKLEKG